jgi:hypothetical protein
MRSQTLSGWPSDTDSLVKTKSCFAKRPISLSIRLSQMPNARHGQCCERKAYLRSGLVECHAAMVKSDLAGRSPH